MAIVTLTLKLIDKFSSEANAAAEAAIKLDSALTKLEKSAASATIGAVGLAKAQRELIDTSKVANPEMDKLGRTLTRVGMSAQNASKRIFGIAPAINNVNVAIKKMGLESHSLIGHFKSTWLGMSALALTFGMGFTAALSKVIDNTARATETQNLWVKAIAAGTGEMRIARVEVSKWDGWIQQLTTNTTTSAYKLKGITSKIFLMMQGMGLNRAKAEYYTKELVKSSLDTGSLFDEDPDAILQKFRSALSRITRPVKILGVDITDKALENYAKLNGLLKDIHGRTVAWKNVQQSLKVEIISKMLLEQLRVSSGDMQGTLQQLANAWRVFQTQLYDFSIEVGKILQPVLDKLVAKLSVFMTQLKEWYNKLSAVQKVLTTFGVAAAGAFMALQTPLFMTVVGLNAFFDLLGHKAFLPFIASLVAAAAAIYLLVKYWDELKAALWAVTPMLISITAVIGAWYGAELILTGITAVKNAYMLISTTVLGLMKIPLTAIVAGVKAWASAEAAWMLASAPKLIIFSLLLDLAILLTIHWEEAALAAKQFGNVMMWVGEVVGNVVKAIANNLKTAFGGLVKLLDSTVVKWDLEKFKEGLKDIWEGNTKWEIDVATPTSKFQKRWQENASEYTKNNKRFNDMVSKEGTFLKARVAMITEDLKDIFKPIQKYVNDIAKKATDDAESAMKKALENSTKKEEKDQEAIDKAKHAKQKQPPDYRKMVTETYKQVEDIYKGIEESITLMRKSIEDTNRKYIDRLSETSKEIYNAMLRHSDLIIDDLGRYGHLPESARGFAASAQGIIDAAKEKVKRDRDSKFLGNSQKVENYLRDMFAMSAAERMREIEKDASGFDLAWINIKKGFDRYKDSMGVVSAGEAAIVTAVNSGSDKIVNALSGRTGNSIIDEAMKHKARTGIKGGNCNLIGEVVLGKGVTPTTRTILANPSRYGTMVSGGLAGAQIGDIVITKTSAKNNHMGIYSGDGKWVNHNNARTLPDNERISGRLLGVLRPGGSAGSASIGGMSELKITREQALKFLEDSRKYAGSLKVDTEGLISVFKGLSRNTVLTGAEMENLAKVIMALTDAELRREEAKSRMGYRVSELQGKYDSELEYRYKKAEELGMPYSPKDDKYSWQRVIDEETRRKLKDARVKKQEQITGYMDLATNGIGVMRGESSTFSKITQIGSMVATATGNPMIAAGFGLLDAIGGLFGGQKKNRGNSDITASVQKVEIVKINKDVAGVMLGISKHNLLATSGANMSGNIARLASRTGVN